MIRILLIIGSILSMNMALATNDILSVNNYNSPEIAVFSIIKNTLSLVKKLKKQKKNTSEDVRILIEKELFPNIAIKVSAQISLKKYWHNLDNQQRQIFQDYIKESLIKDYSSVFNSYDEFNNIKISVDPKVRRKNNKAIVKLAINFINRPKSNRFSIKVIYLQRWYIYDIAISGVSLIKTYEAQFDSHIKRKGIDSLTDKLLKKLAKN